MLLASVRLIELQLTEVALLDPLELNFVLKPYCRFDAVPFIHMTASITAAGE